MTDKAFKWYACAYLGCNHQLYGRGVNLYCDEHRTESPKSYAVVANVVADTDAFKSEADALKSKISDEEIAELEMENQYLREQLADLQEKLESTRNALTSEQDAYRRLAGSYQDLMEASRPKPVKPASGWDPAGIRWSGSSPTGRRPDGTVWYTYTKDGRTVWSPGGVVY